MVKLVKYGKKIKQTNVTNLPRNWVNLSKLVKNFRKLEKLPKSNANLAKFRIVDQILKNKLKKWAQCCKIEKNWVNFLKIVLKKFISILGSNFKNW